MIGVGDSHPLTMTFEIKDSPVLLDTDEILTCFFRLRLSCGDIKDVIFSFFLWEDLARTNQEGMCL